MNKLKVIDEQEEKKNTLAYEVFSGTSIKGNPASRFGAVYRTIGCEYDKKDRGCTMCDFKFHADKDITDENLIKQHKRTLEILSSGQFGHVDFATLGNYFHDKEISPKVREYMLSTLARVPAVKRVLTESRRQYLSIDKLQNAKDHLRDDQILEFALGYETVDEILRNKVLRKGTTEQDLDECIEICKKAEVDFVSYVLIKPPTLTEEEGIDEAVRTAVHVLRKAEMYDIDARIAFEPVFITGKKAMIELCGKINYTPPTLASIVEVIIKTAKELRMNNTKGKLFVGLSDEGLSSKMTSNKDGSDDAYHAEIQKFNRDQDVDALRKFHKKMKKIKVK